MIGQHVDRALPVSPGILMIPGRLLANSYLVDTPQGLLVVDAGSARHVLRCLAAAGSRPQDVAFIVITHWHFDHTAGADELLRRTGARLAVHELDAAIMAGGELPEKGHRAMSALRWLVRVRPVTADILLGDGDEVAGWRVLHVPGHTSGSIALFRDGVVFTGDALLGDRHGSILPPDPRLSLDPATAERSAQRIRGLHPSLVLPGHGRPARLRCPV